MKTAKRQEAREQRKDGFSVNEIARNIGVSKGSVSRWVRDITLTEEQKQRLRPNIIPAARANREKFEKMRREYQEQGRIKARENNMLHVMGCMLFWAEGGKHKNYVKMANTDVSMLRLFVRFLRECFNVQNEEIAMSIQCYTDKDITVEQIENYWLDALGLERISIRKTLVDYDQRGKTSVRKKHLHGTCEVVVHKTEIVQSIFGAIQEYGGFDNPDWLNAVYGSYKHEPH
jgi:predicted transcriptional regulator